MKEGVQELQNGMPAHRDSLVSNNPVFQKKELEFEDQI
jgi:hypothetical protein